jgi:hypothetical protein
VQHETFRRFAEAVHAFAEKPGPDNLERYLAASRALEDPYRSAGRVLPAQGRKHPRRFVSGR